MRYHPSCLHAIAKAIHQLSPEVSVADILAFDAPSDDPEEALLRMLGPFVSSRQRWDMNLDPSVRNTREWIGHLEKAKKAFEKAIDDPDSTVLAAFHIPGGKIQVNDFGTVIPPCGFFESGEVVLLHVFSRFHGSKSNSFLVETEYGPDFGLRGLANVNYRDLEKLLWKFYVVKKPYQS